MSSLFYEGRRFSRLAILSSQLKPSIFSKPQFSGGIQRGAQGSQRCYFTRPHTFSRINFSGKPDVGGSHSHPHAFQRFLPVLGHAKLSTTASPPITIETKKNSSTASLDCTVLGSDVLHALKDVLRTLLASPLGAPNVSSSARHSLLYTTPLCIQPGVSSDETRITLEIRAALPRIDPKQLQRALSSSSTANWTVDLDGDTSWTTLTTSFQQPSSACRDDILDTLDTSCRLFTQYARLPVEMTFADANRRRLFTVDALFQSDGFQASSEACIGAWNVSLAPGLTMVVPSAADEKYQGNILRSAEDSAATPSPLLSVLCPPHRSLKSVLNFAVSFLLNYRFYVVFMARTTFQAVRPLLAFCVFGEVMKLALAVMSSGLFIFFFSFFLAFEVLYFFLQCYISYVFLGMFFTAAF